MTFQTIAVLQHVYLLCYFSEHFKFWLGNSEVPNICLIEGSYNVAIGWHMKPPHLERMSF
jgi:hypothetical protein